MEQIIIPAGNSGHFNDMSSSEKAFRQKEDPQEIANLYGKAIDDLDIILFQKEASVPTFKDATDEEKVLIRNTKVKAAYIVLAINKELDFIKYELMDVREKSIIDKKLQEIKATIMAAKAKKTDPIKSLANEDINFLHQIFNKRFEANLKMINEASDRALAN